MGNQETRSAAGAAAGNLTDSNPEDAVTGIAKNGVSYARLLLFLITAVAGVAINYQTQFTFYGVAAALVVLGVVIAFIIDRSLGRGFNTLIAVSNGNTAAALWWLGVCILVAAGILTAGISLPNR